MFKGFGDLNSSDICAKLEACEITFPKLALFADAPQLFFGGYFEMFWKDS